MKNTHIIKLGGIIAILSFLFLPVAGCGGMNISGSELMKSNDIDVPVKLFIVLSMICAIVIIFHKDKTITFFSAIGGFATLVIAYLIAKSKMHSGNDFGMSNGIELKSGSYLSMLGFIVSAIVSKSNKELLDNLPINNPTQNKDNEKQSKFCQSCGKKIEDINAKFCTHCGTKTEL